MATQNGSHGIRPKTILGIGCGVGVLLIAGCIAAWFLMLRGGGGEPASLNVAERVTKEFVQALHEGNVDAAHQMLSEKVRSKITKEGISTFIERDETRTFQSLDACDWGFFVTGDGNIVSAKGLLHHEDGDIVFESNLLKDSDSVWRIYGFFLKTDIEPKPFGRCNK